MHRPTKRTRRPLSGLTICSEPSSETLKAKAESLGATYTAQLTPKTTHFLAETAGTQAHRKAQTQKTQILRPAWLHQCHAATLLLPTTAHFLPPLSGLTICCTGLDAQEKANIEALCRDTGAVYSRTLGRNCTHLLCETHTGRKYEFAKSSDILIIRPRWLQECARGNVLLDETAFFLPAAASNTVSASATGTGTGTEIGPSAVPGTQPSQPSQPVLKHGDCSSVLDGAVLYLPPSAVSDRVKHAPLHAKALRLAAKVGATVSSTLSSLVTHIIILRSPTASTQRILKSSKTVVTTLQWLEQVCETGRLIEPYEYKEITRITKQSERPKQESTTFLGVRACVGPLSNRDAGVAATVESVLVSGRGKVLSHDTDGNAICGVPTHIVFSADMRENDHTVLEKARMENGCVVGVTPFWVEMCNSAEKLLPTSWCMLFRPLGYSTPVEGMSGLGVTISGFQKGGEWDCRREVLRRVAILLGCRYSERMRRRGTKVLIAEKDGSDKVRKAREWGIVVVNSGWLHECVRVGGFVEWDNWRLEEENDEGTIDLLEKLRDGIEASGKVVEERRRVRSRSVSRDEWSMDASQSQLIVHRDLTPPATQAT